MAHAAIFSANSAISLKHKNLIGLAVAAQIPCQYCVIAMTANAKKAGATEEEIREGIAQLRIELKYMEGEPVIKEIHRVSKPGRRVYASVKSLPRINNGLGVAIVSTPKGVMADHDARDANVGGEILCNIF